MACVTPSPPDSLLIPVATQAAYAKNRAGNLHCKPVKFGSK